MSKRHKVCPLLMISQYDKDMCCLYLGEGMTYIWQQRENQELSRILESLADRKLMKRVHGGYAITLKGLLFILFCRDPQFRRSLYKLDPVLFRRFTNGEVWL